MKSVIDQNPDQTQSVSTVRQKENSGNTKVRLVLRAYLEPTRFAIRTYQNSLKCILSLTDSTGRLERWRLRFAEFEFGAVHRAGKKDKQ